MAVLTDLATELIEMIYHHCGSIDDVLHLARACWITRSSIYGESKERVRMTVMRSVIQRSLHHQFDIKLCCMLDLHTDIVAHISSTRTSLPSTALHPWGLEYTPFNHFENRLAFALTSDGYQPPLTDAHINDILARWQGLRVLQDLWLARELTDDDYFSYESSADAQVFVATYERLTDRDRSRPQNYPLSPSPDLNIRFHAAITRLWLLNEVRWVALHVQWPRPGRVPKTRMMHEVEEGCKLVRETITNPLLDELDALSMYTFLYKHLLPAHCAALADRGSSKLPLTFSSALCSDTQYSAVFLQVCLMAGQAFLQPPDLIELVICNGVDLIPFLSGRPFPGPSHEHAYPTRLVGGGRNLENNDNIPESRARLRTIDSVIQVLGTATLLQFGRQPDLVPTFYSMTRAIHSTYAELIKSKDITEHCLKDAVKLAMDRYCRPDSPDTRAKFDSRWAEEVRWKVWWWANSEDKARMKMNRWMESSTSALPGNPS